MTLRARFLEIAAPVDPSMQYAFGIFDGTGSNQYLVILDGDGSAFVVVGASAYSGVWTPSNGGVRSVHVIVDLAGVPILFIDGVPVPLALVGSIPITFLPDVIGAAINNDAFTGQGAIDRLFVAVGAFPPSALFCCPGGGS